MQGLLAFLPHLRGLQVSGKRASCQFHVLAISSGLLLSVSLNIADIVIHKWDSNQIEMTSVFGFVFFFCWFFFGLSVNHKVESP